MCTQAKRLAVPRKCIEPWLFHKTAVLVSLSRLPELGEDGAGIFKLAVFGVFMNVEFTHVKSVLSPRIAIVLIIDAIRDDSQCLLQRRHHFLKEVVALQSVSDKVGILNIEGDIDYIANGWKPPNGIGLYPVCNVV